MLTILLVYKSLTTICSPIIIDITVPHVSPELKLMFLLLNMIRQKWSSGSREFPCGGDYEITRAERRTSVSPHTLPLSGPLHGEMTLLVFIIEVS